MELKEKSKLKTVMGNYCNNWNQVLKEHLARININQK